MRWLALFVIVLVTPAMADTPVADDLSFQVDVAPSSIVIGKRFTVRFDIRYAKGTRVYFPESPATRPLLLLSHQRDTPSVVGAAEGETHTLELLPVRPGAVVLPPIEVPYVDPSGAARVAKTPEVRLQVGGTLGNEVAPEPRPAGTPVPVRVPNTALVIALLALGAAIVAAGAAVLAYRRYRAWKEAHRPPPPPVPPEQRAFERLATIEAMGLVEAKDFERLALLVSEVVREFLGGRFGFSGVDMTTFEVMQHITGRDLGRLSMVELDDFLSLCDLVKFARYTPTESDGVGLLRRAREIVEKVCGVA